MLLNTDIKFLKTIAFFIGIGCMYTNLSYAQEIDCSKTDTAAIKTMCSSSFEQQRQKLKNQYLTAFLISDAPLRLLDDTHSVWLKRTQQCKSESCFKQQFELRTDDLNFYTSLNQSLTQHYLKFENGKLAQQPIHLQVHQLSKDSIKIEGIAYRNPNNKKETQTIPFLAYTTPEKKQNIVDNEHDCKYQFDYYKAILTVKTQQKGCERFIGVYRLYD